MSARLPLIDEYQGLCHAGVPVPAPTAIQLRSCNRGYSKADCRSFPAPESRSAIRYTVLRRTVLLLEILCIEEADHGPQSWRKLDFDIASSCLRTDVENAILRAQAQAFCRSYLAHFGSST